MQEIFFGSNEWGGMWWDGVVLTGIQQVEARDATQDSIVHGADPHNKDAYSQKCQ